MLKHDDSENAKLKDSRQPYEPPTLLEFGTLGEVTRGNGNTNKDLDGTGS